MLQKCYEKIKKILQHEKVLTRDEKSKILIVHTKEKNRRFIKWQEL